MAHKTIENLIWKCQHRYRQHYDDDDDDTTNRYFELNILHAAIILTCTKSNEHTKANGISVGIIHRLTKMLIQFNDIYDFLNEQCNCSTNFLNNYYKWQNSMPSSLSSCWACVLSLSPSFTYLKAYVTSLWKIDLFSGLCCGAMRCGRVTENVDKRTYSHVQCKSLDISCMSVLYNIITCVSIAHVSYFWSKITIGM